MPSTRLTQGLPPSTYAPSTAPAARTTSGLGASPAVYTNSSGRAQNVCVISGTVSLIEVSRDGVTFDAIGTATGNQVYLAPGDQVRVTYSVLPTLSVFPT